jgi:Smg protein
VNIAIGRARLYAAAVESEERYRRLVELSPDTVVVHSEGIVVYVNEAAVRLMRAPSSADLIGRPVLSFVAPAYREIVIERAMAAPGDPVALDELKIIVLMVHWSTGIEPDALVLDELCEGREGRTAH